MVRMLPRRTMTNRPRRRWTAAVSFAAVGGVRRWAVPRPLADRRDRGRGRYDPGRDETKARYRRCRSRARLLPNQRLRDVEEVRAPMLIKRKSGEASRSKLQASRRVSRSSTSTGAASSTGPASRPAALPRSARSARRRCARRQRHRPRDRAPEHEIKKNICTHCSVGCTVIAEVQNGVWTGQEPAGRARSTAARIAPRARRSARLAHGDRRLKYPLKLVNGQWKRISWDQAIDEIGDKLLEIREQVRRGFGSGWARPSSPTRAPTCSASSAPSGAPTRSTTRPASATRPRSPASPIPGATARRPTPTTTSATPRRWSSSAATRPRRTRCRCSTCSPPRRSTARNFIVIDPRFTRTAAHATDYVRIRPGTDIPLVWGMLWHVFENGWEDKDFIRSASTAWTRSARRSPSGRPRRSSASPACPASS